MKIESNKSTVHDCEENANRYGEGLKQLESTIKEEGLFCVEWCVVMSMSTVSFFIIVTGSAWLIENLLVNA